MEILKVRQKERERREIEYYRERITEKGERERDRKREWKIEE